MTTLAKLAQALGVSDKTLYNQQKAGYAPVSNGSDGIEVEKSVHQYVSFQSSLIRKLRAKNGKSSTGNTGNSKMDAETDWSQEKEKQAAIKLALGNEQTRGGLIPSAALYELITDTFNLVRKNLQKISSAAQKRDNTFTPDQLAVIRELVEEGLQDLKTDERHDELTATIETIIQKHAGYYCAAEEDEDLTVDTETPKS